MEEASFVGRSVLNRRQEIKVVSRIYRVQRYLNKLWCISGKKLFTYSLDCEHLGTIELQQIKSGRALVATDTSKLLVADINTGIHLLTDKGK